MSTSLYLPIILCVASILIAENLEVKRKSESDTIEFKTDDTGLNTFQYRERYMHLMSRFSICFVNVATKHFLFKTAAIQKAWSRLSEKYNAVKFDEVLEKFAIQNDLDPTVQESVSFRHRMRSQLKNSPFKKNQKELYDYYMFLTQNFYELEKSDS